MMIKEQIISVLQDPFLFMGGIIKHSELQMLTQSDGFFGHFLHGSSADTQKPHLALHHQVYLECSGSLFILWYHDWCGACSLAAQVDSHYSYIGCDWKVLPSTDPEIQEAVIFHIALGCCVYDDSLVGEGRQHSQHKADGSADVFSIDQKSDSQQGHQGRNDFEGVLFVLVYFLGLHEDQVNKLWLIFKS